MLSVQGVLDRMGPTLLRAVHVASTLVAVNDVVIAEAGRKIGFATGDLVLGVAVSSARDAAPLVRQCAERGAAGVVAQAARGERRFGGGGGQARWGFAG